MATQRFEGAQFLSASLSPLVREDPIGCCAAQGVSSDAMGLIRCRLNAGQISGAKVNLRLLGKGVGWGLGIESLAAAVFYALWHFRHF